MVYSRPKFERSQFRKLPFGARHFLASNTATAPLVKSDRRNTIGGLSLTTGRITLNAVADTSVAVVKLYREFETPGR